MVDGTAPTALSSPSDLDSPTNPLSPSSTTGEPEYHPDGRPQQSWTLPPRPRPGRKPSANAPPTKRKAQNREAQRAFRERRAAREGELRSEIRQTHEHLEEEKRQISDMLDHERQTFNNERNRFVLQLTYERGRADREQERAKLLQHTLDRQNERCKEHAGEMQQLQQQLNQLHFHRLSSGSSSTASYPSNPQVSSRSCPLCGKTNCSCGESLLSSLSDIDESRPSGPTIITQPQQPVQEMEIDFTSSAATAGPSATPTSPGQVNDIGIVDGSCGFCTSKENCVCASDVPITDAQPSAKPKLPILEPESTPKGPGSCSDCLSDPQRRAFCQNLARLNPPQPRPAATARNTSAVGMAPDLTCAETYDYFATDPELKKKQDNIDFLRNLRLHPPDPFGGRNVGQTRAASAYEVEAASVLTAMRKAS